MKKLLFFFAFIVALTGCYEHDIKDLHNKYDSLKTEQEKQAEQLRNYETILNAFQNKLIISGTDSTSEGYKITFSDGSTIFLKHGKTPVLTLGDNGNWWVDGIDTGIKSQGKDGENGITPEIKILDGYWYINGNNTGVKAEGIDGQNGNHGQNAPAITNIVIQHGNMVFNFSNDTQIVVPMEQNTVIEYSDGIFIVNEGWFGHEQGSVNFYRYSTQQIETELFKTINPGKDLGVTTQYGSIYNQKMYLVSKQGALVTVDPKTMKETGRIDNFHQAAKDGRTFCGVTADLGLVSTVDGIYKLDLNPLSVGDKIAGISGQVGELLQYRQYVFAVSSGKIYVINTNTWNIDTTFNDGKGGLTVSKEGMIWSANGNKLIKINPYTLSMETVNMPNGVSVSSNAWAWTASSLCASKQENALYFYGGNLKVYKYVIGDIHSLNSPLFTIPSGKMIYGQGMNINPYNNQVVVTTIDGYGADAAKNNLYFYDGTTGALKKNLYFEHYWFPAYILFTENER